MTTSRTRPSKPTAPTRAGRHQGGVMPRSGRSDTPEAEVAHPRVDLLPSPGGRPVAQAVRVRTQERAALDHATRHTELWLGRVQASLGGRLGSVRQRAVRRRVWRCQSSPIHLWTGLLETYPRRDSNPRYRLESGIEGSSEDVEISETAGHP